MATWKKVVVSGSSAELAALKVDNLTSGSVVIGGGSVQNLSTTAINGTGNILATSGASGVTITGSFSGSFTGTVVGTITTASYILNAVSASYAYTASSATNAFQAISSSYAFTASSATNAFQAVSASYAFTASSAISAYTASSSVSSSYAYTASSATNAFQAVSASYAFTASSAISAYTASSAVNATSALTASSADNFVVRQSITASNALINGTITAQTLVVTTVSSSVVYSSGSNIFGNSLTNTQVFTGSVSVTGSLTVNGNPVVLSNQTGSMSVLSASFASTASYALNAVSASYAFTASSAISAYTASSAVSASFALTASYALNIPATSSYALTASLAISASSFSVTDTTTGTGPYYLTFVDGTTGFRTPRVDSVALTFNATTNFLNVTASNAFTASSAVSSSWAGNAGQVNNSLTLGNGLSGNALNGSTAITAAVGAGALITVDADSVMVTTSSLTTNQIPKYSSNALAGSNISDTGTQVQIAAGASSGLSVAAGGVNVTGNSTFNNNVVVSGDLTVAGTASFQNTQNLLVADQFILLASGSNTLIDGGIIVSTGGLSGSAMFLEVGSTGTYGRWAVSSLVPASASAAVADEYVVSAKINQA